MRPDPVSVMKRHVSPSHETDYLEGVVAGIKPKNVGEALVLCAAVQRLHQSLGMILREALEDLSGKPFVVDLSRIGLPSSTIVQITGKKGERFISFVFGTETVEIPETFFAKPVTTAAPPSQRSTANGHAVQATAS